MVPKKNPALKKNPYIQNVKKTPSVVQYKEMAKLAKNVKGSIPTALKNSLIDQKILANHRILSARTMNKVSSLSSAEKRRSETLVNEIFNKIFRTSAKNEQHIEFIKEFSKAMNRKEGKEVLEIIEKAHKKINKL